MSQWDVKCHPRRRALPGAEQPIARIPQPRQDVAAVVELAVERGGEDGDVGVGLEHAAHALGRRDETQEADALGAGVLERVYGVRRRAAGREHGIEHEEIARVLAGWDLEIVVDRLERVVLARSEEHTSELQSQSNLVCRLLLEKKKKTVKKT